METVYSKLKGDQAIVQVMVYILANLAGIGLGVYKFHNMGLLPTAQSDWLEFMEARQVSTYPTCMYCNPHLRKVYTHLLLFSCLIIEPGGIWWRAGSELRLYSTCSFNVT